MVTRANVKGRRWKGLVLLGLVAALLVAIAGCGGDDDDDAGADAGAGEGLEQVEMIIPFPPSIALLGLLMATENGYFEDEGIDLATVVASEGSGQVNQQLLAGNQTYGRSGPDLTMIANSQGFDQRMIAVFARGIFTIEAPVGSGIESMEDLRGKSLGITDQAGGEVGLVNQALGIAGLEEGTDVELKVVGPGGPASFTALRDGDIDAYAGATNDFAAMDAEGLESVSIVPEELRGLPSNGFAIMQESLDDEGTADTAVKIIRAWLKGDLFGRENPDEALEIACNAVPEECQDPDVAQAFFDRSVEVATPPEGLRPGEPAPLSAFETIQDALIQNGDIDGPIDLEAAFPQTYVDAYNEGLEEGL